MLADLVDSRNPETGQPYEPRQWNGLYPGTVINDEDPDKGGRLRIRVDQVYGAEEEEERITDGDLPWARPCFPVTGDKAGEAWVPEPGAAVWVTFWGGDPEKPVWLGGWFPLAKIPDEFSSSYDPGPMTRLIKAGGHTFEMRWKAGQEHVYIKTAGGVELDLVDADALDGVKAELSLPSGRRLFISDKDTKALLETPTRRVELDDSGTGKAILTTPTQKVELDDAPPGTITIQTPGNVNVNAGVNASVVAGGNISATAGGTATVQSTGLLSLLSAGGVTMTSTGPGATNVTAGGVLNLTYTGAAILNFLAALTLMAGAVLTITATGALALAGAGITIITTAGLVQLGVVGAKQKLILLSALVKYNAHTHNETGGTTLPPQAGDLWIPGVDTSIATEAN
jgi:hypothetical protein